MGFQLWPSRSIVSMSVQHTLRPGLPPSTAPHLMRTSGSLHSHPRSSCLTRLPVADRVTFGREARKRLVTEVGVRTASVRLSAQLTVVRQSARSDHVRSMQRLADLAATQAPASVPPGMSRCAAGWWVVTGAGVCIYRARPRPTPLSAVVHLRSPRVRLPDCSSDPLCARSTIARHYPHCNCTMLFLPTLFASLLFATAALAHGPALSPEELEKREEAHLHARRAFGSCQAHLAKRSSDSGQQRRDEFVRRFQGQSQRNERRQEATPTQRQIATGTNTASPFTGIPTCVLTPESVQGPYCAPPPPLPPRGRRRTGEG